MTAWTLLPPIRAYAFSCFVSDRAGGPPHVAKGMLTQEGPLAHSHVLTLSRKRSMFDAFGRVRFGGVHNCWWCD